MNFVFRIQKTDGEQPVSGHLSLEEALSVWKLRGYRHPEYTTVMGKGQPIHNPEKPLDFMYMYVSEEDLQKMAENNHKYLNEFTISSFLIGGYHESGS